jgi:enterochelin esterase-like enzyme
VRKKSRHKKSKGEKIMFQQKNFKTCFFLFTALWLMFSLMMQPDTFATGRVEHHQIISKVLAEAGLADKKELSVYLPEEYDTSGLAYPVLYLLHGGWSLNCGLLCSNRVFFEGPFAVVQSVDKLIGEGKIKPLIVVSPDMNFRNVRDLLSDLPIAKDYMSQEVIPFVDMKYRTIPSRKGRAIAGWSDGACGANFLGLSLPEMFSLVGALAGGALISWVRDFSTHNQKMFPLQFWIYCGRNDDFGNSPEVRELVKALEEVNIPHVYIEDDGDHYNRIAQRLVESIVFFSERLGGGVVAVQPRGTLATTWGR